MAALVPLITLIPFLLLLSSVVAGPHPSPIRNVCKASHVPSACEASLSKSGIVPPNADVSQVVESALSFAMSNLDKGRSMIQEIQKASKGNANRTLVSESCLEVLGYGIYRMNLTADALQRKRMKDARAWMSAALAYQYDCWSGLKKVNDSSLVVDAMAFLNSTSMVSSTDALGMLVNYDIFGEKIASWGPPKTEREGFWEPAQDLSKSGDSMKGVPTGLKEDVTVCNNGCKYKTVQAAVDAAPDFLPSGKHFVIGIKAGTYTETVRVPLEKRNVVFLGDGIGKTIITGSLNVGFQGISTFKTATVGVLGDGFMATGVTIQNTAGAAAQQAVAFRTDSDLSILENCEILGNQDTLYAHSLRQYFKSCRIEGNVDFIFGNGAAFFDDCQILIAPRQVDPTKGEDNAVAAHGRTDPAQSTGLFFQNCEITGTEEYMKLYHSNPKVHKTYLGRPWKEYSRAIFINCTLGDLINPDGWMPWDKDFALKTIYFGELENTGLGSNPSKRVPWSNQIPAQHIQSYSILNFINGGDAIPAPAPLPTIPPSPIETPVIPPPTDNDATPPPTNDDVITSPSTPTPSVPVPSPVIPPPTDNDATPPPANDDVIPTPSTPTPSVPVPSPVIPPPTNNDASSPPTDNDVIPTPSIPSPAILPPTDNDSIPSPTTSPPPANDATIPTPPRSSPTTPIAQAPTRSSATTPTSAAPIPVSTPTHAPATSIFAPAPAPIKPSLGTPSSTPTPASSSPSPGPIKPSLPTPVSSSPAAADSALPSADLSSTTPTSAPVPNPSASSPPTPTSAPVPIPSASSPPTPTSAPVPIASSPPTPTSAPTPAPAPPTPAPSFAYAHQRPHHILYFIFCLLPFII